jgi:hypothetical protein
VAIFALLVSLAFVGNGKGGNRATLSIEIEGYSELWLGGTVGSIPTSGLAGYEYPVVAVCCY